ncbi:unnamed protein product [Mycena citricolor]|uniref:Phosphoribosylformylglycinamidine synthase n=1 Tax=Mycena citricolor TaxID=2018698 RepID=A0AAD2H457_9AGAR|nr:unnamed protein product [Mycena citricolor]
MLILPGLSVFSEPKRDACLKAIQQQCPAVLSLDTIYIHLIKCTSPEAEATLRNAGSDARSALDRLLSYGDDVKLEGTDRTVQNADKNVVFVTPRAGSISPWSSKATDIAAICNLRPLVERLERGMAFVFTMADGRTLADDDLRGFSSLIHDRMTQVALLSPPSESVVFSHHEPKPLRVIELSGSANAKETLVSANRELGLALAADEMDYLVDAYAGEARNPTDAELFMFAQVNSEHCRHKIFNASWTIDNQAMDSSLFQMIRNTEKLNGSNTISAYSDNAAVLEGHLAPRFGVDPNNKNAYQAHVEDMPILIKVETHNHPTAVSPFPGAATGSGGEIRDEGAVGRGSKPKAGLSGFTVSNLLIPGFEQPWETDFGRPGHIASALDIMIEGPLGAAAFNNEFGRPALAGYFRTFSERLPGGEVRGYHKPIMIAGGYGNVRTQFAKKQQISPGAKLIVLGGPGLLIGLGGGAASSQVSGAGSAELDFASVQRDNAEMQRRCQQVIDSCVNLGDESPIESIHDVGAGGLSNALPELVHDCGLGATFEIRDVLVADSSMSPMEIWCNESQERYVLAISPAKAAAFEAIAHRERCPFSIVGVATAEEELIVTDRLLSQDVIRLKMSTLFGKPPKMSRVATTVTPTRVEFDLTLSSYLPSSSDRLSDAIQRVLRLPSVGSKSFLITIGDRSVTGLVTRDQMVGPWQVPVADVAVTRSTYGFDVVCGEAMAMGERTPLALLSAASSARIAVAESLTNLAAACVGDLSRVKLSANWMCAASEAGEGAGLYAAVQAVGMDLCPALGVGIPVGKDSMSMSMKWRDGHVTAPLSLIVTAFAAVEDVSKTWTPQLSTTTQDTVLVFLDIAADKARLGGSALAQVFKEIGSKSPDVDDPALVKAFFEGCQAVRLAEPDLVLAYHDRSDGGLFTTVAEMAFAGHAGIHLTLDQDPIPALFNEELGAVVQVERPSVSRLTEIFAASGFPAAHIHVIGEVLVSDETFTISHLSQPIFSSTRAELQQMWAETSYKMQSLRDNAAGAKQEFDLIKSYSGACYDLTFGPSAVKSYPSRPRVAILREQGVNGHIEMAWAFTAAGFEAVDVHMSDILGGSVVLDDFRGLAACGGFAYGDVLGAGKGWAHSVLLNATARDQFTRFFARADTFALAVCNGCQFLSQLREIIPGAQAWPEFKKNQSERFEARVSVLEIVDSPVTRSSVFFRDMAGSKLPIAVAHGEGRAVGDSISILEDQGLVAARYVDGQGNPTEVYPLNPNGSPRGITGIHTPDGRVLAMMPHPERVASLESNSWYPKDMFRDWQGAGPWFQMFKSAREWCN